MRICSRGSRRDTAAAAGLSCLAVVTLAAPARAIELEFSTSAPCPSDDITFRVQNAMAQPLASIEGPTFRVSMERVAAGYVGQVDVSQPGDAAIDPRERRVVASSCDELVDTLALTLVLAIAGQRDSSTGSNAASAAPPPANEHIAPVAAPSPLPEADDELDADAASASDSSARARLGVFGAMVADAGSLPALGLGLALGADITWPAVELRALGMILPGAESSVDASDPASPGAELGLVAGGLLVCAPLSTPVAGAQLAACVGGELGRLSGHGTRIDTPHSSTTWWSAPRADVAGRWALPLSWLALELGITVAAPIWRDEFVLEGVGSVHRAAPVIGRASLSLRADFGQ